MDTILGYKAFHVDKQYLTTTRMNPTLLLASIAAAIIGSAQAGYVYIYSPYASTQCQPGSPCAIAWNVSHDGPEFSRIDIELLAGETQYAKVIAPIALGYDLSQGNNFLWNVPQSIIPEGDYFIRIKGVGTDYQSYSHIFPIGFEPHPTSTVAPTETSAQTSVPTPTRTGSQSSVSTVTSTTVVSTVSPSSSTSSAMSIKGSISIAAAAVAVAFAALMF